MKKNYIIIAFLMLLSILQTKAVGYYFYVQFKDKNGTSYSLSNPSVYLSQRALDRRNFFNIAIDSTDLPVNESYVSQIQSLNLTIHSRTKWLNGITVSTSDSALITPVNNLNFVKSVTFTGKTNTSGFLVSKPKFAKENVSTTNYGSAATQINQLNGAILHDNGFRGQGMIIAVIDAGFYNANINVGFDSLRNEGRLLGVKNFVNSSISVYTENSHGANVLSTMAGNIPNTFVGTAPKASYWLLQSEANNTETLIEPDLWVSAIEYADSVGADISTTSLGYTTFDNPATNYTYSDMNGITSRASIAATLAANKGIMVLNSAGNDATKPWHYIGAPADADKIITVGAVTSAGIPSSFSSFGPTSDGRLKPELSAMGSNSALIGTSGTVVYGSGTSYACPILAGMTTCFLQAAKEKKPSLSLAAIRDIMYRSANLYSSPTYQMGYGIPNFVTAYNELVSLATANMDIDNVKIKINRNQNKIYIEIGEIIDSQCVAKIHNVAGNIIQKKSFDINNFDIDIQSLQSGIYILSLDFNGRKVNKKIIVQ